jgi:hypothetical protein
MMTAATQQGALRPQPEAKLSLFYRLGPDLQPALSSMVLGCYNNNYDYNNYDYYNRTLT